MTQEEKAKAYDEALEDMRAIYPNLKGDAKLAVEHAFPELSESEDERIRTELLSSFKGIMADADEDELWYGLPYNDIIAWLEKQKENPKSADSIPSDCVSDVKCEDRSPKHSDSDGIDIRDTPAYWRGWDDAMKQKEQKHPDGCFTCDEYKKGYEEGRRNGFTAGYNKAIKEVEQKEQKPTHFELKAGKWYICHRAFCCRADHLTVKEGERFMCEKDGVVKGFVIKEPEKYFKECSAPAPIEDEQKEPHYTKRNALFDKCVENCDPEVMKRVSDEIDEMLEKEQKPAECIADSIQFDEGFKTGRAVGFREGVESVKPAEWSEEDEKQIRQIKRIVKDAGGSVKLQEQIHNWFKSLRPSWKPSEQEKGALKTAIHVLTEERNFPKAAEQLQAILDAFDGKEARKDWKPTEEQMRFLLAVINEPNNAGSESCHLVLKELYEQLKTL